MKSVTVSPPDEVWRPARRWIALCALSWTALAWVIGARFSGLAPDDIFITYRYAQNLAGGHGFVFNPGERVFGLTDPAVGLILGGLAFATRLSIPLLGTVVTAVALLAVALLLAADAPTRSARWEAVAAGTLALASPVVWDSQGSGPLMALAALVLGARLVGRRPAAAGLSAGLAVWLRPDAVVGCLLLGVLAWRRRSRVLAYSLACGAVVAAGGALARLYFGTYIPNTLAAKRQFAALQPEHFTGLFGFWGRALDVFSLLQGGWVAHLVVVLAAAGLWQLRSEAGFLRRFLLLYGCLLVVVYTVVGVPFFIWYIAPLVVCGLHSAAGFLGRLGRLLVGRRALGAVVVVILLAGIVTPLLRASFVWWAQRHAGDWRHEAYRAVGSWLRQNSAPWEDVAFDEVGLLAFYSERPVQDLIGLVTPRSMRFAAQGDQVGAFLAKPTRFVVFHTFNARGGTRPIVSRPWFSAAYEEAATLEFPRFGARATIYRQKDPAAIPPPRPPIARGDRARALH